MVSADAIRTVVGIIGNLTCLGLFLSPLPTFYRIWKNKTVEQFSVAPYLTALLSLSLWIVYSLPTVHPHSLLVFTISVVGFVIELAYVLIYITYANNAAQRLRIVLLLITEFAFTVVVAVLVLTLVHGHGQRSLMVGILCDMFGPLVYAAPLSVMRLVINTKSVEYMPLPLSIVGLCNCTCWVVYALIPFDIFMFIPTVLGATFGVAQLVLYGVYYKSTKIQMEERKKVKPSLESGLIKTEHDNPSNIQKNSY